MSRLFTFLVIVCLSGLLGYLLLEQALPARRPARLPTTTIDLAELARGVVQESARQEWATQEVRLEYSADVAPDGLWSRLGMRREYRIVITATARAEIDMAALRQDAIRLDGQGGVILELPPAETTVDLSPEQVEIRTVYETCWAACGQYDRLQALQELAPQARADTLRAVDGLEGLARQAAIDYYRDLLARVGVRADVR